MKLITNKMKTSFRVNDNDLDIVIHKYVGCGDELYLTCYKLKIDCMSLHTNDINEAVQIAKKIIRGCIESLVKESEKFLRDDSEIEVSLW